MRAGEPIGRQTAVIDIDRLRAALRLALPEDAADEIAALAHSGARERALRRVYVAARNRLFVARMRARLPWRRAAGSDAPAPSLALALYLALDLDADRLAAALGSTPERLGRDLFRARATLDVETPAACEARQSALGRYRDPSLDQQARVGLLTHLRVCDDCRETAQRAEAVDARLLGAIDAQEATLPAFVPSRRARWRGSLASLAPPVFVAALVLALVAGGVAAERLVRREHVPVPAVADADGAAAPPLQGWLLQLGLDGLEARDLATGRTRTLNATPYDPRRIGDTSLSPDARHVAYWRDQGYVGGSAAGSSLDIQEVGGGSVWRTAWSGDNYHSLSGWLDNATLLLIERPAYLPNESTPAYNERTTSKLVALDINTGTERVLLDGDIGAAYPSPDGTLIAIQRRYDPRWSGAPLELRTCDGQHVGAPIATIEHRVVGQIVWSPDSARVYMPLVANAQIAPVLPESASEPPSFAPDPRIELTAISRDGQLSTIVPVLDGASVYSFDASPDGRFLLFRRFEPDPEDPNVRLQSVWRVAPDGRGLKVVLPPSAMSSVTGAAIWSPDGTMLLQIDMPHYLNDASKRNSPYQSDSDVVLAHQLVAFDADWRPRVITTRLSASEGTILRWLPPDAFPPLAPAVPASIAGDASTSQQVHGVPDGYIIDGGTSVGPNGEFLVLRDTDLGSQVIWNRLKLTLRDRHMPNGGGDVAWLTGEDTMVSVVARQDGAGTWLSFNAPIARNERTFDFIPLDPAQIDGTPGMRYARPLAAPDGNATSFFVIDDARRTVALWVAGWDTPAQAVASWSAPPDALLDAPLATVWADNRTLLFVEPRDWSDGLPQ